MNRRSILVAGVIAVIVVVGLLVMAGGDDDAGESIADDAAAATSTSTSSSSTTTTTSTTTIAPEDIEPVDEALDIDREFSSESQAEALGPIGATETTIPTDEGIVSIGGGEVPELSADFPLPDGFEVQLTTEVEGEVGYSGRVDGELGDLVAFYEQALAEAEYEIVDRQSVPGVLEVFSIDGPLTGDIVISEEPGGAGWTILVGLAEG